MKYLFLLAVVIGAIYSVWFMFGATWCSMKASDMGISSKYTMISGCLVSDDEKIWVSPRQV